MPDIQTTQIPPSVTPLAQGPSCAGCEGRAVVQWQRRPTVDELAVLVAAEEYRRAEVVALAGLKQPPTFGPMPTAEDTTVAVFACAGHAVHIDHAARIHAADCPAPNPEYLPDCGCEPEPHPEPEELGGSKITLPTGWTVPAHRA